MFAGVDKTQSEFTSFTVTSKVHDSLLLPEASVAVQVTGVVPTSKLEPGSRSQDTFAAPLLSLAVTAKLTLAPEPGELSKAVMSAGQLIVGSSMSLTVTVKVHVSPDSVEAVTNVVPIRKT
jgi:hypothetical protein